MAYQGRQPGVGVRNRFIYSATGGQTSFSGADSNGLTLAYADATYVDVFLNGTLLVPVTDYAATTKTSVVLGSGAAASDIVEIVAYDISSMSDAITSSSGGTITGNLTVNGNFSADGGTIKLDGNYPVATHNVALGDAALDDGSLTGGYNIAIGSSALSDATSGNSNIAVGYQALRYATTAAGNVSVGVNAMRDTSSGGSNIAVGQDALRSNTTASANTAVGYQSLYANTTGDDNVAIGRQAMVANTTGANNVAVGSFSFDANTTGGFNTALGRSALSANTTASYNTAVGQAALQSNTTAGSNTAVGYQAGYSNTTGSGMVALGRLAYQNGTTGNQNVAIGNQALLGNTTGSDNVAVGAFALENSTTANWNVALGRQALYFNTTASQNTASGYQAGYNNSTGSEHAFFGFEAGHKNTTGNYNTFIGRRAGYSTTTGSDNTIVGNGAGSSHTTGSGNGFFGTGAGNAITTGSKNTILGRYNGNQGGVDIRTSSNNIVLSDGDGNPRMQINSSGNVGIGQNNPAAKLCLNSSSALEQRVTQASNGTTVIRRDGTTSYILSESGATTYRELVLGNQTSAGGTIQERMRITSSGKVRVGTEIQGQSFTGSQQFASLPPLNSSIPAMYLHRTGGDGSVADFACRGSIVGSVSVSGSSTSYNTSSDHRLKENVVYDWDATTRLKQLKPARFNFIADADTTVDGFLAHEAQAVVPESVLGTHNEVEVWKDGDELPDGVSVGDNKLDDDGNTTPVMQGIDQAKLVPLLVKTIQELEARITALEA
jgi:hypothetical protein